MLDICLLGTGGMMPLTTRYLTSCLVKYNGVSILIDCGEATQLALRNAGESSKDIDVICITHFHADHISGLAGMLLLMGNQGKTSLLTIIGPKGIKKVVESLRIIAPVLPYDINYLEINDLYDNEYRLCDITRGNNFKDLKIKAFKVNHKIECYGYTITLDRLPEFLVDKAMQYNIPKNMWNKLQHGETVEYNGVTYIPDMVMGPKRKGLKMTYVTDSRPCDNIIKYAQDSDLFICEGMYGDTDEIKNAKEKKHMLMTEAADIAKKANVTQMWLTHYSPSVVSPKQYQKSVSKIFANTIISEDGQRTILSFE